MTLDLQGLSDRIAIEKRILLYAHYLDSMQFERIARLPRITPQSGDGGDVDDRPAPCPIAG